MPPAACQDAVVARAHDAHALVPDATIGARRLIDGTPRKKQSRGEESVRPLQLGVRYTVTDHSSIYIRAFGLPDDLHPVLGRPDDLHVMIVE